MQKNMEDYFINLALISGQPSVILFDRGCADAKAYTDDETFQTVLDETGYNLVYLRDKRYDAVLHLITAADGAEKFYTSENNVARYENVEQAIETDRRTIKAWTGHQRHIIIDNSGSGFDFKLARIIKSVEKFIGQPVENSLFKSLLLE